jgi:hypothetical protein
LTTWPRLCRPQLSSTCHLRPRPLFPYARIPRHQHKLLSSCMSYLPVSSLEIVHVMCRPFRIWGMLYSWFAPSASSPILPSRRFGCDYGRMLEYILTP